MTNDMTNPFPTKAEAEALELIRIACEASPFEMEPFRKLAFNFKAFLVARRNGKTVFEVSTRNKVRLLAATMVDVTGTIETLVKGIDDRLRADRIRLGL